MKRTLITPKLDAFPSELHPFLIDAPLYDSSCSPEARVIYIERDGGYFLKSAPKGTLAREAELTRYFHSKGLAAEVLTYCSDERDWLLSHRVRGEDCTDACYLADPKRLCDTIAERLRLLHETDFTDCPVQNRTEEYLAGAERNFRAGMFDPSYSTDCTVRTAEEAWRIMEQGRHLLKQDTLIHGDYCLPNLVFDGWRFSGFIDLGNGGVSDRHIDLFWGAWTLCFNLKTDRYRDRFFDAYGREAVDPDVLRLVSVIESFG